MQTVGQGERADSARVDSVERRLATSLDVEESGEARHAPLLTPTTLTTELSLLQRVAAFFGASTTTSIRCPVCLEHVPESQCIALRACGHMYCRPCFTMFLEVNIREGQVYPTCFYEDGDGSVGSTEPVKRAPCGVAIDTADIELLVSEDTRAKFRLFRFNQENEFGRQCPYCSHSQLCGGPANPRCRCSNCGKTFCFLHANAHEDGSCESYERQQLQQEQETHTMICRISKECPQCKTKIEKDGGCNHLRCSRCGTNFCWMCGSIVDNSDLPSHFQWWNLGGCAGLMRAEIRQDTGFQRVVAKLLSVLNFVFIGPASFVLAIILTVATLGCLPCVCYGEMSFGMAFLLAMELSAWILLLPLSLTTALYNQIRRCFQKQRAMPEDKSISEPQAEIDPATVV